MVRWLELLHLMMRTLKSNVALGFDERKKWEMEHALNLEVVPTPTVEVDPDADAEEKKEREDEPMETPTRTNLPSERSHTRVATRKKSAPTPELDLLQLLPSVADTATETRSSTRECLSCSC